MGYSIASAFAEEGALVTIVSGPTAIKIDHNNITVIDVVSALEMYDAVHQNFSNCDIAVMCAAVADYRPVDVATSKLKRKGDNITLDLTPNPDIAASVGAIKSEDQILVGFALETGDGVENAENKIKNKKLDLIVLNSMQNSGAGFQVNTNKITIIDKNLKRENFSLKLKSEVAKDIVNSIICRLL